MKLSRLLTACGIGVSLMLGTAATAGAITYGADLILPKPDGTTQVHVEGFVPGVTVDVSLVCGTTTTPLTTTPAEPDGTITVYVTLPTNTNGCSIKVVGGAVVKSFALGTTLPTTGSDSGSLLQVGLGLLALGLVSVVVTQLRRRTSPRVA